MKAIRRQLGEHRVACLLQKISNELRIPGCGPRNVGTSVPSAWCAGVLMWCTRSTSMCSERLPRGRSSPELHRVLRAIGSGHIARCTELRHVSRADFTQAPAPALERCRPSSCSCFPLLYYSSGADLDERSRQLRTRAASRPATSSVSTNCHIRPWAAAFASWSA